MDRSFCRVNDNAPKELVRRQRVPAAIGMAPIRLIPERVPAPGQVHYGVDPLILGRPAGGLDRLARHLPDDVSLRIFDPAKVTPGAMIARTILPDSIHP